MIIMIDHHVHHTYQVDWAVGSDRGHDAKQASTNGACQRFHDT